MKQNIINVQKQLTMSKLFSNKRRENRGIKIHEIDNSKKLIGPYGGKN